MWSWGRAQILAFLGTNADVQAWCEGIHTALIGAGLVQTADTGQLNLATAVRPSVNTAAGYEIFRFSDTLQSTTPVFIKIEYGIGTVADRPALWMTSSGTTNGAGTLGAGNTPRTLVTPSASKVSTNTLPVYASGDTSRFSLLFSLDTALATFCCYIGVERTKDSTGTYTSDGWIASASSPNGGGTGGSNAVTSTVSGGSMAYGPCIPIGTGVHKS